MNTAKKHEPNREHRYSFLLDVQPLLLSEAKDLFGLPPQSSFAKEWAHALQRCLSSMLSAELGSSSFTDSCFLHVVSHLLPYVHVHLEAREQTWVSSLEMATYLLRDSVSLAWSS